MTEGSILYGSWSMEDAKAYGKIFLAKAVGTQNYNLTKGREYKVEVREGIFETRPYVYFTDDNGKPSICHLTRFEKIQEVIDA